MARAKKVKIEVTESLVKENLPSPPEGYSYSVERVTPMVIKVWLYHDDANYSYTNEPVYTIHSFIKRDMVHQPKNTEKMKVSSICHLSELSEQSSWSTLNQPDNPLVDLLS
tara:strand:+ start:253 stop:585 length:333 start_codon:yes stop_codon:yes gene_type:complete